MRRVFYANAQRPCGPEGDRPQRAAEGLIWINAPRRWRGMIPAMEDRAEALRRRIAVYRRYLEEGVESDLAAHYLREIITANQELERLTGDKRR